MTLGELPKHLQSGVSINTRRSSDIRYTAPNFLAHVLVCKYI